MSIERIRLLLAELTTEIDALAVEATPPAELLAKLSRRQLEVARLIVAGKTIQQTAELLNLSPRTVEVHRARIQKVLGIKGTARLVAALGDMGVR